MKTNLFILHLYSTLEKLETLISPLGTEHEIQTSAFLQSASMLEGKQLFPPTSTTITTLPEPLNCLFNNSQSSQNKYANNNSCVFNSAMKYCV